MRIGVLLEKAGRVYDAVEQRSQAASRHGGKLVGCVRSAAISSAHQRGFLTVKGDNGEGIVGNSAGLGEQLRDLRDLLTVFRGDGAASVDQQSDVKPRELGAMKAAKIPDDNVFVNDGEIAGKQGGDAVMVLIGRGKRQTHLGDAGAEGDVGSITGSPASKSSANED